MFSRRNFLHTTIASSGTLLLRRSLRRQPTVARMPVVVSTWDFGQKANVKAWEILSKQGRALDAVEEGVKVIEADASNMTVGVGGLPDRDGKVTLDACIMDEYGNAGSVCFLEHISHPISVARMVMERTPHVMLAGEGALDFALSQGFKKENILTKEAKQAWEKWKKSAEYKPIINVENHDTIAMLALDHQGRLAGACTTSGLAYKLHGRVGDSPIIGAGLYVDPDIGGAAATGLGEAVMRTVGSFLVVELMRQGRTPQEACMEAVERIAKREKQPRDMQIGYLALDRNGEVGAYSLQKGFTYALQDEKHSTTVAAHYYLK
ncbi:MAG: N(4)-(beta-N-acetylglucosaminyl)-L-asparaginase [Saprospiraceae bacterium]|nr:N(4)-(beta-N-acetylglucosaminyl)-L-asparaginase [Saprospiraceae bacterium]